MGIRLWEVHKYSNGFLVFNEAKSPFTREPITTIAKSNPIAKKVTEEIKVYTEEDYLNGGDDDVKELYSELKSTILTLGNDLKIGQVNDPLKKPRDVKDVGHYSSGKTEIIIKRKGGPPLCIISYETSI